MEPKLRQSTAKDRFGTMLAVDLRRMFRSPVFYIITASCLLLPIIILVMTTMMDGSVSVDPQTGKETVIEGLDNLWQIIGTTSEASASAEGMQMDMVSMCNINMLYFFIAVLVCTFVSEDFRSGFSKNLFTVRAKKSDYVFSKTLVCSLGAAAMVTAFIFGSLIGGVIAGLPFDMIGFGMTELVMCLLSKVALVTVFVPIYLLMSVIAKQRLWLSLILSFMVGMFLFMMIPMISPLDSTVMNPLLCLGAGIVFGAALGTVSDLILKKTSLV